MSSEKCTVSKGCELRFRPLLTTTIRIARTNRRRAGAERSESPPVNEQPEELPLLGGVPVEPPLLAPSAVGLVPASGVACEVVEDPEVAEPPALPPAAMLPPMLFVPPVWIAPPVPDTPPEATTPPVAAIPPVPSTPPVAPAPPELVVPPLAPVPPVAGAPPVAPAPPVSVTPPVPVVPPVFPGESVLVKASRNAVSATALSFEAPASGTGFEPSRPRKRIASAALGSTTRSPCPFPVSWMAST